MLINNKSGAIGLLILGGLAAFLSIRYAKSPSDSSDVQARPPATKRSLRPDSRNSHTAREDDKDPMVIIRDQLDLLLSDTPDLASLDEALAACRRLKSTSSIIELLSDPRFGWKRMSATTLFDNSNSRTFVPFAYKVHKVLFERWGELDLDGALKTLKNMLPPPERSDFDEGMVITFNLYKGAARAGDGRDVLNTLIPPGSDGYSEHDMAALGYLIEGWAGSDPDAAWQTLVTSGGYSAQYFKGLHPDTDWTAMSRKVEEYAANKPGVGGNFRRDLTALWIRHEPNAALAWFGPNSDDPLPNRDNSGDPRIASHAAVITEWLIADPQAATRWLATWQSDTVPVPKVLSEIDNMLQGIHPNNATPEIREAVGKLLRDGKN